MGRVWQNAAVAVIGASALALAGQTAGSAATNAVPAAAASAGLVIPTGTASISAADVVVYSGLADPASLSLPSDTATAQSAARSRRGTAHPKHQRAAPKAWLNEAGPRTEVLPTIRLGADTATSVAKSISPRLAAVLSGSGSTSTTTEHSAGTWRVERQVERVMHIFDLPSSPDADAYLACAGSGNLPERGYGGAAQRFECYRVDRAANTQTTVALPDDWFCVGAIHDANGDIVVAGGTRAYPVANRLVKSWGGSASTYRFDAVDDKVERLGDLNQGRWYANPFKNENNDIYLAGGQNDAQQLPTWEVMRNGTTTWATLPIQKTLKSYPDMELIGPDTFAYTGATASPQTTSPFIIDMNSFEITPSPGLRSYNARRASSALLTYPAQDERVLIAGGLDGSGKKPTDALDLIDYSGFPAATPSFVPRAPLPVPMGYVQMVNLPNGEIFATGGARGWRTGDVLWAGFYDPQLDSWRMVTPPVAGRDYHTNLWVNTDGSVSVSGGNPTRKFESRVETYTPWYFDLDRPSFSGLPAIGQGGQLSELSRGSDYTIDVDLPEGASVGYFTLDAARASTHVSSDPSQAMFSLPFEPPAPSNAPTANASPGTAPAGSLDGTGTSVTFTVPETLKLVPGTYRLSIVTTDQVPSPSVWVKVV